MCWLMAFVALVVVVCLLIAFMWGLTSFLNWLEKKSEFLLNAFLVIMIVLILGVLYVRLYIEMCTK